jgi:hypothetical protein
MKGITRKTIFLHLLDKQFGYVEMTVQDALLFPNWKSEWKITSLQEEKFKKYAISIIKGVLKISKSRAEKAYNEFKKTHGLSIKN